MKTRCKHGQKTLKSKPPGGSQSLAELLNEWPGAKRIASLVRDLQQYKTANDDWLARRVSKSMPADVAALRDRIAKALRRYASRPDVILSQHGWSIWHRPTSKRVDFIEDQAFNALLHLLEHEEFKRLKNCAHTECGQWFFAERRTDRKFCSEACQQAAFNSTEERKRQKRERAREAYRKQIKGHGRRDRSPKRRKHHAS
jgi:predicted RNA-binding Zn ribbon-like protein